MDVLMVVVTLLALAVAVLVVVWAVRGNRSAGSAVDEGALAQRMAAEVRAQVGEAAVDALVANNEQFLALAEQRFEKQQEKTKNLLDPFEAQMKAIDKTVDELRKAHEQNKGAVDEMNIEMARQITELTSSTATLSEALRSPTARGAWGENQLRNVIDRAGMLPYCDYVEQATGENREGTGVRPDVRVRLSNGAYLAVDAKVPLNAYLKAQEATEKAEIEGHLVRHAAALRGHVKKLAEKKYWDREYWDKDNEPGPEFVVLFVPGESFLADALRADVSLLQYSMDKRVLLASPINLLGLLWTVAKGWQEKLVAESNRQIADLGKELYSRMKTLLTHVNDVKNGLRQAVDSYNKMVNSLEQRLLVSMRKFPELGGDDPGLKTPNEVDVVPTGLQAPEYDESDQDA